MGSPNFNIRCHAIPGRWLTFFILNTGGKALEWFHAAFCRELSENDFYERYVPGALGAYFDSAGRELPGYTPFLGGSRYSTERLTAAFTGVSLETTREDLLLALIRGNASYHGEHLKEVAGRVKLGWRVATTGGVAKIRRYVEAKKRWTGDFAYEYRDQSSLKGAAMLGQMYLTRLRA
jgi:sugar (pentulose or hexulose) kinase